MNTPTADRLREQVKALEGTGLTVKRLKMKRNELMALNLEATQHGSRMEVMTQSVFESLNLPPTQYKFMGIPIEVVS